ncbi:pyridoxamine 5'-phosphate oxidase family protein [Micromonospora sp. NPDC006766]|uniref:pyridoxamine 5'-phosphate oxidase family protein n=1 Tax=Micromonospora sp. NPDC006766 TaxID=3154778 RepID=UPI0033FC1A8F
MPEKLDQEVLQRLRHEWHVWLCTLRPDGSPHVTPVWFVFHEMAWWVGSSARNKKVRNLARDPRVSLALEGGVAPVVAEGSATIHRDDFPADIVEMFKGKYDGWDITALVTAEGARVLIQVPVARWLLAGRAQ